MTILGCWSNQLTRLDFSENPKLRELKCHTNQLTTLDVSQNTALTGLICGTNQLKSLNVSRNTILMELRCEENQLTNLELSQNKELRVLFCGENPFVSDVNELTATANGLLDWTGKAKGNLSIENPTAQAGIQSICDAKNWEFL